MSRKVPVAETHPELVSEAIGLDLTTLTAGSDKLGRWRCRLGHEWEARIKQRTAGSGCPFCSGRKVLAGFNDLASLRPGLASEANGWDPTTVTLGSNYRARWRCDAGHVWDSAVKERALRGRGCPFCSGTTLLIGERDLSTVNPALAREADGWDPSQVAAQSNKLMPWRCAVGHTWTSSINNRMRGNGCPYCGRKTVLRGFNDLCTTHPQIAKEASGWDPSTVLSGSNKRLAWSCSFGHTWLASPNSRTQGHGCPICSNHAVLQGFNDLLTTHPEIAHEAHGWNPSSVSAGASKIKREWRCSLGHIYLASPKTRTSQHQGCPYCANKQVMVGFNDLRTTHPEIAAEASGWDPSSVVAGANMKKRWRCKEDHEWMASPNKRTSGRGCPTCANSGFDPNELGWLYLVLDDGRDLLQVGISNKPQERLKTHARNGFDVVLDIRGPQDGQLVRDMETAILQALRRHGAIFANKSGYGRFDGWAESWSRRTCDVATIRQLLDLSVEELPAPVATGRKISSTEP